MSIRSIILILGSILAAGTVFGQLQEGEIAENFVLQRHGSEETVSLYDFEEHVIVLDFFAYWCGPCQTSSPELETGVAQYYEELGGTQNGAKVVMLAVSIDNNNAGAVNSFVENAGLELVGLDSEGSAWRQFGAGYVPHFAVVNGLKSSNYEQWEVIHSNYGYRGATFYRNQAERVVPNDDPGGLSAYEAWVETNVASSDERGVSEDPDGDGLSNLYEFACGSNPDDDTSRRALDCSHSGNGDYIFRYARSKTAGGVTNVIQISSDLTNWSEYIPSPENVSETDLGDHWNVEIRIPRESVEPVFARQMVALAES